VKPGRHFENVSNSIIVTSTVSFLISLAVMIKTTTTKKLFYDCIEAKKLSWDLTSLTTFPSSVTSRCYVVITTTIRLRLNGRSTAYQRSLRSQWLTR